MNWHRKAKLENYHIEGFVLGCLKDPDKAREYGLVITEELKNDPWIAIARTEEPVSKGVVKSIWRECTQDPDGSGVPYYFIVKSLDGKGSVVYTDEYKWYPINSEEEKATAIEAGRDKGLKEEHLDF